VRIEAFHGGDGSDRPLHARLTVLPGLADEQRALVLRRLIDAIGTDPAAQVLRAADLPGAIVSGESPALGDPLARARQRQEEEATLAAAMVQADRAVTNAQDAVAAARERQRAAEELVADAAAAVATRRAEVDALTARRAALEADAPVVQHPTDDELRAAAIHVERCRDELARVQEVRVEAAQDLVDALEATHNAVLEAEERGGLFGRRKLTELRAREAAAAEAVGVSSYEAWLVRSSGLLPVRDERSIEAARDALAAAEVAFAALEASFDDPAGDDRQAELLRLDAELAAARAQGDDAAAAAAAADGAGDDERAAVDAAEQALAEARADRDAIATMQAVRAEPPAAPEAPVVDLSTVDPAELEMTLLSLLVSHETSGQPLLVDDAFGALDADRRAAALDVLAWASEAVQVVYLEPGRAVAERAAQLGPDLAAVIDLRAAPSPAAPDLPTTGEGDPSVSSESTTTEAAP
jgi:hypothetical protein